MANYNFYISNKEIKREIKESMRGSWAESAKVTTLFAFISLVLIAASVLPGIFVEWWISIPVGLISMLLISILSYGYTAFCYKLIKQEKATTKTLFCGFSKKIMQITKLSVKKFILGILWLVMAIFPFFIKSISYSMATFLMIDREDIHSDNALKESSHLMQQNHKRYFKFVLSFFWWYLLVVVSAGIAGIWVAPRFVTSKAIFYENLKTEF